MRAKLCFIKKTANYFQLISVKEGIWITFIIKKGEYWRSINQHSPYYIYALKLVYNG
ncbi:hypothetical protein HMPREF0973_00396 [Prevotella veroralis F0319]|uniref:Uncharacterized protein n=1 Tax=Prevotella veroralis F0319 TaxID=649761 RepID=C9MLC1_9BACT|nr:hypothetical protein HMPREF0973_00396 [Prevotella veroralis F0319]